MVARGTILATRPGMNANAAEKDNTIFNVGDAVSYMVGSDQYAAVVVKVSPSTVQVQRQGEVITFTKRLNGRFIYVGRSHGLLSHGGKARLDPCF